MGCTANNNYVGFYEYAQLESALQLHTIHISTYMSILQQEPSDTISITASQRNKFIEALNISIRKKYLPYMVELFSSNSSQTIQMSQLIAIGLLYCSGSDDDKSKCTVAILSESSCKFQCLYNIIKSLIQVCSEIIPKVAMKQEFPAYLERAKDELAGRLTKIEDYIQQIMELIEKPMAITKEDVVKLNSQCKVLLTLDILITWFKMLSNAAKPISSKEILMY